MRLCVVLCLVAACGSSDSPPPAEPDAPVSIVLGPLMPQVLAGHPVSVMATPTVMPITWDGDANRADIEAFFPQYAASSAWAMQTAEYGIGPLTVAAPQHLTGTVAATDAEVRSIITANVSGTTPAWGAANEQTIYSVFLPMGTTFDDGNGGKCCVEYDGYHDDFTTMGVDITYAIQCSCTPQFPPGITALQELTTTASHETVEAVTDPRPEQDFAFGEVDPGHSVWAYVTDGELGDLCEFADTAYWTDAPNMTYTIQRMWSNAAARAGTDPCVGDPAAAYYQGIPAQPAQVTIDLFGGQVTTKAAQVAVGAKGTISVQIAGTEGSGPFTVTAFDVATIYFGAKTPLLTFVQPTGTFAVNERVSIGVTVKAKDTSLGVVGAEAFEIDTKPVGGGPTTYFYGLIAQ